MTNEEIFAARIARINAGAANTKGTVFIGQDEQLHPDRLGAVKRQTSREIAGNAAHPLSLIGAFGLGLCAVALGTYARFQLMAGQAELENADLEMALSGMIGLALSFVLAQMFRLTSKTHKVVQAAGVFVMVCGFHNFAHWAPEPMALAFSPAYVAQIQTAAPANSARFRGAYLPLFDSHSALAEEVGSPTAEAFSADADPALGTPSKIACKETQQKVKIIEMDNATKTPSREAKAGCAGG